MGTTRIKALDHALLRAARTGKGWTPGRLAVELGLTAQAVMAWESGDTTPEPPTFVLLAKALGLTPAELLTVNESEWTLVEYRITTGLNQAAVADQIGVAPTLLSNLERGYTELRDEVREALAAAYGLTSEQIQQAWQRGRDQLLAQ